MTAVCNNFLQIYYARISGYLNSLESETTANVSDERIIIVPIVKNNFAFTRRQDSATQECNMSGLQGLAYTNGAVSGVSCDN